jgi:Flp pilus assembly pilin Flp
MASPLAMARRIAAMSPDEIRTRAKMAIRQRLDAWEVRRGKNPLQPRHSDRTTALPRFFFDSGEAAIVAAEVRRRVPSECESVIESAQEIRARRFELLGYRGLSCGDGEIEWHRDPVHGIAAPDEPWFRVPYLDFSRVGDHKIVWELSRHQHLMLLARAWLYTGDGQFLNTLQSMWEGWRKANPYPMGINWASTLEVAFRCLSWIWVDQLTSGAADFHESFRTSLREGIGECAVYTERYMSTYFAPNTHLLGEVLALFFVGVLYPGFERARFWRECGWRVLLQESARQVREDGFHFEQSVYYHIYALDMFIHARILAARNGILVPEPYDRTLRLMAEGLATIGAAGKVPRFGDDDGGRLFDGRRNRSEHMLDPLGAAAILYGRGDWKVAAGDLREETIWLLGIDGIRLFDQLPTAHSVPRSRAFAASGYYTMASGNGIAVIDAGPHGWGNGGHGHADALSMQLIAGGRAWLTDPGTGSYPREKPQRDLFRGTAAHNTLEVDSRSQADPVHAFGWGSHPVTRVHRWHNGKRIVLFHGAHDGYARLTPPVTHERWVIGWHDDLWMVADRASGEGVHRLDLRWHIAPECAVTPGNLANVWRLTAGQEIMEIIVSVDRQWNAACEAGDWSPNYGAVISAPVLHFSREGSLPADFVTFLAFNQLGRVSFRNVQGDGANVCLCTVGDSRRLIALAERPGVWHFDTIESDAELFVIEFSAIAIEHMLISGVSAVRIGGKALALEDKIEGIWEAVASAETGPLLSPATTTALLQVLERLSDSGLS